MSNSAPRILLVEDAVPLARTYTAFLKNSPFELTHVETGVEALAAIEQLPPDILLLDLHLPDMNGLEILRYVAAEALPTTVVVITAHGSINVAVDAMRAGAFDFLVKPFSQDRLLVTLSNAAENRTLRDIVHSLRDENDSHIFHGFVGSSLPMQAVYRTIESVAPSKATVFIHDESGTGKEVCALAIHAQSPRADKPFVAVNCAALPKDLMESEMFGHVKGAFTGATADRDGAADPPPLNWSILRFGKE